jgi:benzoate transport
MSSIGTAEHYIRDGKLTSFQLLAVVLCAVINVFDGFDAMTIAYTAPSIATEWDLSPARLGIVFSAGFLGMAIGALTLGTLSDRIGRRRMILWSLAVLTITMGLTSTARSIPELLVYRFVGGLAIGAMLASITAITAEYSPDSRRNLMICFVQSTYAVGATFGGMLSAILIEDYGWRSVFWVGALLNAGVFVVMLLLLPESLAFLLTKQPRDRLPQANKIIARLGGERLADWPARAARAQQEEGVGALFHGATKKWSLLLWTGTFTAMFGVYFLMSWIPKIVVDAGVPLDKAILVGMAVNAGGLVGILWLGYRSATSGLRFMVASFMAAAGVLMVVFGLLPTNVALLMAVAVALGFFGQGGFIGLYSVAARIYPTAIRATGIGWAIGLGRVGAIIGPSVAGVLIGLGWSQATYFTLLSLPFFIGAIAVWSLKAAQLEN